ncbi:MAG TPA: hypothetical protein VMD29_14150 [Terracidiphilus sp.]|jgi:hypothetical protein|nr:hypothetical protein [Terracidiphilus sp.]
MSQQPELSSISPSPATQPGSAGSVAQAIADPPAVPQHPPQRIPPWLERAELFLRVLLRLYIGLAVCYAPWSRTFWDDNPLFLRFPTVGSLAVHGAVRGIISGLGVLNLWIAFREAIRNRNR